MKIWISQRRERSAVYFLYYDTYKLLKMLLIIVYECAEKDNICKYNQLRMGINSEV